MKANRLLLVSGLGMLLLVFAVGIYVVPKMQSGNSNTARQSDAGKVSLSDVYVDVTYATPDFVRRVKLEPYLTKFEGRAQPFLVGINTHVGTIADLDLRGKVLLEDNEGNQYPSLGSPVVLSEHHNMYLLAFPLVDHSGKPIFAQNRGHFKLLVRQVGKTAERSFVWKLPVMEPNHARTLASALMMALGVVGALMVILSPCAIELTTYYTGIISGVASSAALAEKTAAMPRQVRSRILRNLAAFVSGFTILYMASGATVALVGKQLLNMQPLTAASSATATADPLCTPDAETPVKAETQPAGHVHGPGFGSWTRWANWAGASFLIFFAVRAAGLTNRGAGCLVWASKFGRKFRTGLAALVGFVSPARAEIIRRPALSLRKPENITPLNSFCAGLGLSVSCLTCMGGAILYPLLIFVGTSSWQWGALILGSYSLALAVPMALIAVAVGNFAWQYLQRPRWIRSLQWSSAAIMVTVALLIMFDRTRFINSVVFTILTALGGNPDPMVANL